ncbi:MAG: rhomboid family intramembrane serine protease [Armatimonadetes bacterium]|nr:rhomboid family intramembrane serine protease [Armatimonadota bacterium]
MIPLRDHLPGRTTPVIVFLLILINVLAFLYENSLSQPRLESFVESFGMIPYEITRGEDLPPAGPEPIYATLFSSMFMHGSWLHLIGNMLYLWIFGNNVEDVFGRLGFILFYLVVGLAGHLGQIFIDPASQVPLIGASGAIAGVMGAYLVFFPRARVDTVIFMFYFVRFVALPAIYVLGFWILIQFVQGALSIGGAGGGVAWWAHIGGFAGGVLIALLFRGRAAQAIQDIRTYR